MEIGTDRELEAALRLQRLSKRAKFLARARGTRVLGKHLPLAALSLVVGPPIVALLARNEVDLLEWGAVPLIMLIGIAILEVNNRVDALLELLEGSSITDPDLKTRGDA